MIKKILAALLAFVAVAAFAAVDVNKATQAELEAVKGIGPSISTKIIAERNKAPFKDWNDMVDRVKGVGVHNAATFSGEGLTVNGTAYAGAPAAKADDKKTAKADPKKTAAPAAPAPAASAAPAAPAASTAAEKKAASKQAKEDKKAEKAAAKAAKASQPAMTTASQPQTK